MAKHTLKILRCECRKIFKVCLAILQHYAWKDENMSKSLTKIWKKIYVSKNYDCIIYTTKKTNKKRTPGVWINSIMVGAVAKTGDEVYVLITMKIYRYFSFVFSTVSKKVELLKYLKWFSYFITTIQNW